MTLWRRLVREAHRRSLWQVLGVYLFGAWIGYQVVLALYEGLALPEWVPPLAVILFIIGLPVVLATALVQEGPPGLDTFQLRRENDPTLLPGLAEPDDATKRPALQRLTWRRSLVAGVAAFTLLAVAASGFVVVRNRATLLAQGVLDESDVVLLADFATRNAPDDVGAIVTEALRIDLQQSGVLRLAETALIASTLARMQRESVSELPVSVAREVAVREGWKAVLAGEIGMIGGGYVLTAQLVTPDSGRSLASFRTTAADSTELLGAVDELSKQVRARIGESLRTVRAAPRLERVSTSSLAALRKYVEATRVIDRTGDQLRGVQLLEEAVTLDSTFAMAWRRIGIVLQNLNVRPHDRNHAMTRAWELRDRLDDIEAQLAIAGYEHVVRENGEAGMVAYRRVLDLDPNNRIALNNLAVSLNQQERYGEAAELLERAIALGDVNEFVFANLVTAQFYAGDVVRAFGTVERAKAALPDNLAVARTELRLAAATQRWQLADSLSRLRFERSASNTTARLTSLLDRLAIARMEGRVDDARRFGAQLERGLAQSDAFRAQQRGVALALAESTLELLGDTAAAVRALDDALRRYAPESFDSVSQAGYTGFAVRYARAGQQERATDLLRQGFARAQAEGSALDADGKARAVVALLRGDPQPVLDTHQRVSQATTCRICDLPMLGRAYELAGHADSARAAYDDFLTLAYYGRLGIDPWTRPDVLRRSAALHAAAGNRDIAIERYAELLQLWERADPVLQARVDAIRGEIARLRGPG
jgi:eukaryotic-like serine/threonine-protein kinase